MNSVKTLFTQYLFFSLSFLAFFTIVSITFGIHVNSSEFFKPSNSFFKKSSQEAFISVFKNEDIITYEKQLKEYALYQVNLNKFSNEKEIFEKLNKGKTFPKHFAGPIVPEPTYPLVKSVNLHEINANPTFYSLASYKGHALAYQHNLSCDFIHHVQDNIYESSCFFNDTNYIFFKKIYKTKYKILTVQQHNTFKELNGNAPKESALLPILYPNTHVVVVQKNIILGNLPVLGLIGFAFGLLGIFVIALFHSKNTKTDPGNT